MERNQDTHFCNKCTVGKIQTTTWYQRFSPNGKHIDVELLTSVCDNCGNEHIETSQQEENLRRLKARKVHYGSTMMGEELLQFRLKYGLTKKMMALIFGKGARSFTKYEQEQLYPSKHLTKLLNLAIAFPHVLKEMADKAGVEIPLWKERCEDEARLKTGAGSTDEITQISEQLARIVRNRVEEKTSALDSTKQELNYLIDKIREELGFAQNLYDNMKAEGLSTGLIESEGYLRAFKSMANFIRDEKIGQQAG